MKPSPRNIKIAANFTEMQDREIEAAAYAAKIPVSTWLFHAALEKLEREKDKPK